jgi:hypothetical protein
MKKYIVTVEFADKDNLSKHYRPGDELPGTFGEDRLANIVSRGLAKVEDTGAGAGNGSGSSDKNPVTDIDLSAKVADLLPRIKVFEDVEKLKQYLEAEKAADKPRSTVVKAIEARLADIVRE